MRLLIVTLGLAIALPSIGAEAESLQIVWPTFFRVGPSKHHQVLGELFRGTVLDVRSCTGEWCQVRYGRATGYVERATLGAGGTALPADRHCFDSVRAGYGAGEQLRFCGQ